MRPEDEGLEDIISSLNTIREQLESSNQAASPYKSNDESDSSGKADEESASLALEEYLASRLQQIGEVTQQRKEVRGLKTGNGWDANQIAEHVFKIDPIPVKRAIEIALSSHRSWRERIVGIFRRRLEAKLIGTPTVEFIPIWRIKGIHECYYLRTNTYKVKVKDDVVGVDVEGRSRDLILERRQRRFIPTALLDRFRMLGSLLGSDSKYFVMSDVLELATKRSESELTMTGLGKPLSEEEEMAMTSWRSRRIFDLSDLKARGARVLVRECTFTKDALLNKFREQVIRMPERFKQILSNRLQISELKRIYVPLIRISIQKGLVPREVIVNGSSGELADSELLELVS